MKNVSQTRTSADIITALTHSTCSTLSLRMCLMQQHDYAIGRVRPIQIILLNQLAFDLDFLHVHGSLGFGSQDQRSGSKVRAKVCVLLVGIYKTETSYEY